MLDYKKNDIVLNMERLLKGGVIALAALVLTVVVINASEMVPDSISAVVSDSESICGPEAIFWQWNDVRLCVDQFEASASGGCPHGVPTNPAATEVNVSSADCQAVSVDGAMPWRFVSLAQAQQLCSRSQKRLPTAEEWYRLALPLTSYDDCVLTMSEASPATSGRCQTPQGVSDMIGNVWEWVDESVSAGAYNGRQLPESGFVIEADAVGIVTKTGDNPSDTYGNDFAVTAADDVYGVVRGGFYASGDEGGLYAVNAAVPFSLRTAGIGFRCVRDMY